MRHDLRETGEAAEPTGGVPEPGPPETQAVHTIGRRRSPHRHCGRPPRQPGTAMLRTGGGSAANSVRDGCGLAATVATTPAISQKRDCIGTISKYVATVAATMIASSC